MIKRILIIALSAALLAGCTGRKQFAIEGKIANTDKEYFILTRIDVDTPVLVDSLKIRGNGSFRLKVKATIPEFYQIGFRGHDFITLLAAPGEKIKISFSSEKLSEGYTVSGSPGTDKIITLDSALAVTKQRIDSLKSEYNDALKDPQSANLQEKINQEFVKILKDQRLFNISFILENLHSLASVVAIYQKIDETTYVLYDSRDLQFLKIVSDTLSRYYPDSKQVKALKNNFEKELNQTMSDRITELSRDAPVITLDPSLNDINGKRITLSSLRGKYVLLSFWSAASNECLAENLELKKYYASYKNKGFEIYQVNLDTNEETWRKAVSFDELPWINVREDDPLKPSTAMLYNVRVLPANYLYDKGGNIIAKNIHGKALQIKLTQLFGN